MTHVRAIRKVVCAEQPAECLVQERRLVRGAAGRVELDSMRIEAAQLRSYFRKGALPGDRQVTICRPVVTEGLNQPSDFLEVVIGPGSELCNGMIGKELRC